MLTDDLIAKLAAGLEPTPSGALTRRLSVGLLGGTAFAVVLMLVWLGVRSDLSFAVMTSPFWMKAAYTLLLTLLGFVFVEQAGRPGARLLPIALLVLLAFAIINMVGMHQMMQAPKALKPALFLGQSYKVCPWSIVVISTPVLIGVVLSLRGMAPTRPTLAGAIAGLLAGAVGATVYGLHCTESSAMFVAFWYSLGIAGVGALGALCGRYLLRW